MALFDFSKLNQMAKNLGDRTSDVIETTKLNGKLAAKKLEANEELLKIGQFYYDRFLAGQVDENILDYCNAAKTHLDAADQIQAEIDRINANNNTSSTSTPSDSTQPSVPSAHVDSGFIFCSNCGNRLSSGTKFCNQCGNKIE